MHLLIAAGLTLLAAVAPAQWPFNIDFNGNNTDVVVVNGEPVLLVYNLLPRTVQAGDPHRLFNFHRPLPGTEHLRIEVDQLWFYDRLPCVFGRDVMLQAMQATPPLWTGTVGAQGKAIHDAVGGIALTWPAPSPAGNTLGMGVLSYDLTPGPLQRCRPAETGQSPAFLAVCRFETLTAPSVVQFTGFETGDLGEFSFVSGAAVQNAVVRTGSFAMTSATLADGYAYATLNKEGPDGLPGASLDLPELYLSFYFRYSSSAGRSRIAEITGMLGATKARLELETSRRLGIQDFDHAHRFVGTTVLQPNRWYRVRWLVPTGMVATTRVWVDDVLDIDTDGASFSTESTRQMALGRSSQSGGAHEFFYDDVVISTGGFVGDSAVRMLYPDGPGAYSDWSGTFGDVNQWPHDGDATVSTSSGEGSAVTYSLQSPASAGITGEVLAVKSMAVLARQGGSSSECALRLRAGATDVDSAGGDGGAIYRLRAKLHQIDPSTGLGWLLSDLGSIEAGAVKSESGSPQKMTAVGAQALFVPQ